MKAVLVLEDGFTLEGTSFTGAFETGGEVIFTTGMGSYQELLTDPVCHGQLVCMTYPLIGNYGINKNDMESPAVQAAALLVKECCHEPSNWRSEMTLPAFLQCHGTAGVEGLDTRALACHLREKGSMRAMLSTRDLDVASLQQKAQALPEGQARAVQACGAREVHAWYDGAVQKAMLDANGAYAWRKTGIPLLVYDYGCSYSLLRRLEAAGFEVLAVPPSFEATAARATGAAQVFLSSGPGDPAALTAELDCVRQLVDMLPVSGVGLGMELLALALGGRTAKLPLGHHGCNHPVRILAKGTVEIATLNNEYQVLLDGAQDLEATHVDLHDNSVQGLKHSHKPVLAMQYLPENAQDGSNYFLQSVARLGG